VAGVWTHQSISRRASTSRTVAEDTPRPPARTSSEEATGSPDEMYSRTSAERARFEGSDGSLSTLSKRLLRNYTLPLPVSFEVHLPIRQAATITIQWRCFLAVLNP